MAGALLTLERVARGEARAAPAANGRAEIRLGDRHVTFTFETRAGSVHVTGPGGADATHPQAELLAALHACGCGW